MSGKTFAIFVIIVLVIVGGAVLTLMDQSSSSSGNEDPVTTDSGPTDGDGSQPDTPDIPVVVDSGGKPEDNANPEREMASDEVEFDPGGQLVITGVVTAANGGEPIEDAEVEILYQDGDPFESATTDAEGRYTLEISDGIPAKVDLRAWGDGFATRARNDVGVSSSARSLVIDFELRKWFTVEGRVVSAADGTAIADATVEIRSLMPMYEDEWDDADTDENGFYRIEEIEDLPREGFDVWADSASHVPMLKAGLSIDPSGDVLRIDFELWDALLVRGVVISGKTGQPIEDAEISVTSRDPEFLDDGEEELSNEDGSFEMELDAIPFDGIFVLVSADEHSGTVIVSVPRPTSRGEVNLGDIILPEQVVLSGVVVNKSTGQPIQNGDISIYARGAPDLDEGDYTDSEFVDELGRFEISLEYTPRGPSEVYIEADGYFPLRTSLTVPPNVLRHEVRFEVEPVVILRGLVRRKADRSPVAGARVRLLAPGNDEAALVGRTRANGQYIIEFPVGAAADYAVIIEYADRRFPMGRLEKPGTGMFEIDKDFVVDLPPMGRR